MNKKVDSPSIKTAFILGAGLGTRLRPYTDNCPKPLLALGGRPIITYAMDHLMTAGIRRFIINTHHRAEVYQRMFPDHQWRGIPIIFRYEPVLLDSAGGLKNIEDLLDDSDETILVYNGDTITDLPLIDLIEAHGAYRPEITLALRSSGYLLNVDQNERNEVCDIRHILGKPGIISCQFVGIYLVERPFLDRLQAGHIESVVDVFIRMIREEPGSVRGVVIDAGVWHTVLDLDEYRKINELMSQKN